MRKILLTLWLLSSVLCCLQAQDDIAVLLGEQYVLRNVATGTYLKKDGIVSGNDFYPTVPQMLTAVFEPDVPAAINSPGDAAATYNSAAADLYDLAGRKITTPHGGQIIIRNRKKVIF